MQHRGLLILMFLACVGAIAGGVWRLGYQQGLGQLELRGTADLELASDRLMGQLERYRALAVYLADHPVVMQGDGALAAAEFLKVADSIGAREIFYVTRDGEVAATARDITAPALAGSGFVRRAMQGALGWGHGAGTPLEARAYYYAAPVFAPQGAVQGAVVVAVDIDRIEDDWAGNNPAVFFTDDSGQVFISNRSELIFWQRPPGAPGLEPPTGAAPPFDSHFVAGHEIWLLGWGRYLPERALHLVRDLPIIGLRAEVLLDTGAVRRLAAAQALAVAALCLAFGALLFLATERRRTLAEANAQLEARVVERTAELRRAQADLVQAGKLSALGHMSAGISHELNQPLMAIRSYAENAVQFLDRGQTQTAQANLARISDMARRMGRIIKNFRAFARQESEAAQRVDVLTVLHSALELTEPRLRQAGVQVDVVAPAGPIWVRGGEVRLGQVFVNLITNAADAMSDGATRLLRIDVTQEGAPTVTFADTGPGIEMPDKVFDPFYSTKLAGSAEGMGLGLSISYGIVQSFGGDIRGANSDQGAVFTVRLEAWQDVVQEVAA